MKQSNFFPIERNHYFFGKLLTAQDFTGEQEYFNNKRRLLNRFLWGAGVVSGLSVIKVDEKTISVESGMAIDSAGREVVVDSPRLRKLTMIDGYDQINPDNPYVYLCAEYDEEAAGQDYSPAEASGGQFSKYREGCRFYLSQDEPEESLLKGSSAAFLKTILYRGGGIVVTEQTPRLMESGEKNTLFLQVENHGQARTVELQLEQSLSLLKTDGAYRLRLQRKLQMEEGETVTLAADLEAMPVRESAEAQIVTESFALRVDGRTVGGERLPAVRILLTTGDLQVLLEKKTFEESFERILGSGLCHRLYLARIYMVSAGSAYMIDRVECLPFRQYVLTGELLRGLLEKLRYDQQRLARGSIIQGAEERPLSAPSTPAMPREASGTEIISLGIGAKAGRVFYSRELAHGLGIGRVEIRLQIEEDDFLYAGDKTVFSTEKGTVYSLGAKINPQTGTFVIGVRAEQPTVDTQVKIHWSARSYDDGEKRDTAKQISIAPSHIELKTYERIPLEAKTKNLNSSRAIWKVNSLHGGSIDANGVYTAPGVEGIFEIEVVSEEDPTVRNTTFVIVRDA